MSRIARNASPEGVVAPSWSGKSIFRSTLGPKLKNAEYFEKKGYGFLVEEQDIGLKLFTLIKMIHKDKNLLIQIKEKQKNHSDKSVFKKVDMYIKEIISE